MVRGMYNTTHADHNGRHEQGVVTMNTIWFKGDELTITSEPFMLHGGEFVTAVNADGKEFTVATRAQQARNAADRQSEWKKQQAEFAKLA